MFLRHLFAAGLLLVSPVAASAVTIQPGETYEGTYNLTSADIGPSLPILSIDGSLRYLQYSVDVSDFISGETLSYTQLLDDRSLFGSGQVTNTGFFDSFVGGIGLSCIACVISETGFVQVTNTSSAAIMINQWIISGFYDVTVELNDGSPFATQLVAQSPVVNFRLLTVTPPVDPPPSPNPVPLPAPALFLLAGIAGLGAVGRRRKV